MKKRKYLRIVWALLALSFVLGYGCANIPKGGVAFEKNPRMNTSP
jgi:hypothetical protein